MQMFSPIGYDVRRSISIMNRLQVILSSCMPQYIRVLPASAIRRMGQYVPEFSCAGIVAHVAPCMCQYQVHIKRELV